MSRLKRVVDVVGAGAVLVVLSPVALVVALLVRVRLGAPVLFRQQRAGLRGQPFEILKFRTMTDTRDQSGALLPDDQRLTRLGEFMRSSSLDELPELLNVLRGEMSLVGPRPLPVAYLDRYTPEQARRHDAVPGVTGWAQVNGRNSTSWAERFELDLWYVDHRSLRLDLRILVKTLVVVLSRSDVSAEGHVTMPELPFQNRIFLSKPDVRPPEREAVLAAIDSGWATPAGPDLAAFEAEVSVVCGVEHGVALSSGTAALHLALLGLGVGAGDAVLVSTFTFAATANAITYVGATPVFVDSDVATWNLSPELLEAELAERAAAGRLPAAVISVDLYGQCADYRRISPICDAYDVPLIEDAAEAIGATLDGRRAGSFGRMAAMSFNGNKLITTSGGGMLVSHDEAPVERARFLSTQAKEPAPYYEHHEIGYNYRLSNLLAAFGRGQLSTLPDRIARRREFCRRYTEAFASVDGVEVHPEYEGSVSNRWLTCIQVDPSVGFTSEDLRLHLETQDIESRPTWKPMHQQRAFAGAPTRLDGTSDQLFARGLCLPSGSGMSDAEFDRVLAGLDAFVGNR